MMSKPNPIPFYRQLSLDLAKVQTVLLICAEQGHSLKPEQTRELAVALEETRLKMVSAFQNINSIVEVGEVL